ncbi:MAG: leucyl/phenylalanyl-tRNA--protein transferase [Bdellovibrionales bacterium]|nr:leucyl/phenylalanyl-tRNA--protein transferase [Bdellovibrionales bacterium]
MPIQAFPDPRLADDDGLLAIGGQMDIESLTLAYRNGIFPWPIEGLPLPWFSPPKRAILRLDGILIGRSLKRALKNASDLRFTLNRDFEQVIQNCAVMKRPGQKGTWITRALKDAYVNAHRAGIAHSVEVWSLNPAAGAASDEKSGNAELVGGIYGMEVDGAFSAESMFYKRPYASKLALWVLSDLLRAQGCPWIDIQMMTPHLEAMGAVEISRDLFLDELARVQSRKLCFDWSARELARPKG